METTVHNPDRYMGDLRQILAQGRKRIGLLVGAGEHQQVSNTTGKLKELKPVSYDFAVIFY